MMLYSGHKSDRHGFGTGFFISRRIMNNLSDFEPVKERIFKIRVTVKYQNLTLISTHVPTEEDKEVTKEEFYCSLEKVCNTVPNDNVKIVLGDFNAGLKNVFFVSSMWRAHSLHNEINDNGKLIINFAMGRDLAVMGTWYQHQNIHKFTWKSLDKIRNQIDHVLVDLRHL